VKVLPAGEGNRPESREDAPAGAAESLIEAVGRQLKQTIVEHWRIRSRSWSGLAERGEIDPWNINIIEVTDRFLNELERRRELNLKLSGRTLFYAATLLRMKSEQLLILASPEGEEAEDDATRLVEDYEGSRRGD